MTVHVALQSLCDLWALVSPFIEQLGANLLQPFMRFILAYPKKPGRSCGWDTCTPQGRGCTRPTWINSAWLRGTFWGVERCQGFWSVCRKAGSHWFMQYLEMEGLHFSFKGCRSLVWGGLCWEKILGNFLLILQIICRDEGCFCFPKTDLERKYCLKLVSAFDRASAKRC